MKFAEKMEMQATAVEAAKAAGAIMSRNHFAAKKINESPSATSSWSWT